MTDDSQQDSTFTRRRLLGTATAGGAAAAASLLPSSVQKALATPSTSKRPSLRDVEHVVLLMQENRSFDHYFGTMSGVAGFSDPDAIRLPTGRNVFYQPTDQNADGYVLPFHLDSRTTSAQGMPTAGDYAWDPAHMAWNEGKMDMWLPASYRYFQGNKEHIPRLMGYFEEQDIPFHRALADAFTICDHYHCSILGSTTPNRVMWETGGVDPDGKAGGPILINAMNENRWRTYAENLTDAGVSWRFYQEEGGMRSQTGWFKAFREAPSTSPLYTNSRTVSTGQFEYDAINDRLPSVSWLFPPTDQNEHPNQSMPAAGAQYIASKIDAIAANPDVWAKTVLILVWDENGGMFDHVPPPTPPPGTPEEFVTLTSPGGVNGGGRPLGAGFRVPCIIISPWTAGGWVCSEPFDHTSNLRFLERVTGVAASNISGWRRDTFGDLTSAFRFRGRAAEPPTVPSTSGHLALAKYEVANLPEPAFPEDHQTPPVQERGRRPSTRPPGPR
ncbi:alkaline phosphatase family protein [Actinophytocola gossypii]|uniref:phospholipase C n=1 Tax=Actinophytocola gossypii TaxID=2812003 RepID=A0ABT2J371_9PSEU|nr:alkaline phosphatase family protein [Actinophytocola gossypii]MCT2582290.1 phospholipase [Actinophytocola gossypii]